MKNISKIISIGLLVSLFAGHATAVRIATTISNRTGQEIIVRRIKNEDKPGYGITINSLPCVRRHFYNQMEMLPSKSILAFAKKTPVVFGNAQRFEFSYSRLCPGSSKTQIIEAKVSMGDEEFRLCFDSEISGGEFFVASDLED